MLEPSARLLYLEELRPPEGYRLDYALATTYTLDLLSLLMAPLSMVLFDCQSREEFLKTPFAALEALKRTSNRLAVFSQTGQIAVPSNQHLLYSNLEASVVQVYPSSPKGVFHPKLWLLRFLGNNQEVMYRLICLSRNLTFDRSWDTALVLEGDLQGEEKRIFARNRPLADFVSSLPGLAVPPVPDQIGKIVETMKNEIPRINFQTPEGFNNSRDREDLVFAPMGINKNAKIEILDVCKRLLIVSPFLSEKRLEKFAELDAKKILVSRVDSLDAVSEEVYGKLKENGTEFYSLDESAERPNGIIENSEGSEENSKGEAETPEDEEGLISNNLDEDLSGLHAKLYLAEYNSKKVHVWTGSANATEAAFTGQNVEFMVRLTGTMSKIGIDKFLGMAEDEQEIKKDGPASFLGMLRPYQRPAVITPADPIEKKLDDILKAACEALSRKTGKLSAQSITGEQYTLRLGLSGPLEFRGEISGFCYPITLHKNSSREIRPLAEGKEIEFTAIPAASLTSFIAFKITARFEGKSASKGFVLKFPAEGFPEDRDSRILRSVINDPEQFLKYLLFLLSDRDRPGSVQDMLEIFRKSQKGPGNNQFSWRLPLFEELVRAFSRDPEKIKQIALLVKDFQTNLGDQQIIPEEFLNIWGAFLQGHAQLGAS
jgi:hypothetical protein